MGVYEGADGALPVQVGWFEDGAGLAEEPGRVGEGGGLGLPWRLGGRGVLVG